MPGPVYGALVPLIGRVNTSILAVGQVRWFVWSAMYQELVEHGYADIYVPTDPGVVIALKVDGAAPTYANLPTTGLTKGMVYVVGDTGRAYVWSGTAWPAQAAGMQITGPTGNPGVGIVAITASGTTLVFEMTVGPSKQVSVPALVEAKGWRDDVAAYVANLQNTVVPEVDADRQAAQAARAAAETARGQSQGARDAAIGARDAAAGHEIQAGFEADAAHDSEANAAQSATAAGLSAAAAATTKGQVDAVKGQVDTIKTQIDTARDDTNIAKGAAVAAAGQSQGFRDEAEQIVADAAAGVVPNGGVTTPKIVDGAVTAPKLDSALQTRIGKADTASQPGHTHTMEEVVGLGEEVGNALSYKADLVSGKVPANQIPAEAMTDFLGAVASQAAMLTLVGQRGDWCTRTDRGTDWQLIGEPSTSLVSWREKVYPASPVQSVAGRTGAITLGKTDVGLGNVNNTSDADKPVSTATAAALAAKVDNGQAPFDIGFVHTGDAARKVGLGGNAAGVRIPRAVTFTKMVVDFDTPDASGSTVVRIDKGGPSIASVTITAPATTAEVTGPWPFAAGDRLFARIDSIGGAPVGKGCVVNLTGVC